MQIPAVTSHGLAAHMTCSHFHCDRELPCHLLFVPNQNLFYFGWLMKPPGPPCFNLALKSPLPNLDIVARAIFIQPQLTNNENMVA